LLLWLGIAAQLYFRAEEKGAELGDPPEGTAKEASGAVSKEVATHDTIVEPARSIMTDEGVAG
jgi:hypothetical protein